MKGSHQEDLDLRLARDQTERELGEGSMMMVKRDNMNIVKVCKICCGWVDEEYMQRIVEGRRRADRATDNTGRDIYNMCVVVLFIPVPVPGTVVLLICLQC